MLLALTVATTWTMESTHAKRDQQRNDDQVAAQLAALELIAAGD